MHIHSGILSDSLNVTQISHPERCGAKGDGQDRGVVSAAVVFIAIHNSFELRLKFSYDLFKALLLAAHATTINIFYWQFGFSCAL
jgi:hypothetical protein